MNTNSNDSYEQLLSYYTHEIPHYLLGLESLLNYNFGTIDKIRKLSDSKLTDTMSHIKNTIDSIQFINQNLQYLLHHRVYDVNLDFVSNSDFHKHIVHQLLYEVCDKHKLEIEQKSLEFIHLDNLNFKTTNAIDSDYFSAKRLVEIMLYNIINNAVTHSYQRTNIYIECYEPINKGDLLFKVINYGTEIDNSEKPYEIFSNRYTSYKRHCFGIGLYVVNMVIKKFGWTISHYCTKISDYNIPLLESFVKENYRHSEYSNLLSLASVELTNLQENKLYDEIVSKKTNRTVHSNCITDKTFKTIFEVSI